MSGPEEQRLDNHLLGADSSEVAKSGSQEWANYANILEGIAIQFTNAAGNDMVTKINGLSGPALVKALGKGAAGLHGKSQDLAKGSTALGDAADAIDVTTKGRDAMNASTPAMADPGPRKTAQPGDDKATMQNKSQHNQQVADFEKTSHERETKSRALTTHMDTVYAASTETMKQISGYQDPAPHTPASPTSGDDSGVHDTGFHVPASSSGSTQHTQPGHVTSVPATHQQHPGHPGQHPAHPGHHPGRIPIEEPQGPHPVTHGPNQTVGPVEPGSPITQPGHHPIGSHQPYDPSGVNGPGSGTGSATPGSHTAVGETDPSGSHLGAGVVGGLAAGGLIGAGGLSAALRNGGMPIIPGLGRTSSAASIGSTSAPSSNGLLSRSSAPGLGESEAPSSTGTTGTTGTTGATGARTGTSGEVGGAGGAGGRGGASGAGRSGGAGGAGGRSGGGRGAGGAGGGRGKNKKRGQGERDLFDDGQDWLDDEGSSPPVLD